MAWGVTGVEQSAYTLSDTAGINILTIPAVAEENDEAEVVCIAVIFGGAIVQSEPAILRVQGMCSLVASTWL